MDTDDLEKDILASELYQTPAVGVDENVKQYNGILYCLLDKYTPEKPRKVAIRDNKPWMKEKIANAKNRRGRFGRR